MSAYDSYMMYNALKLHFNTEKYDYFKYSGKIKSKLIPENQHYIFDKIYKRYGNNLEKFYVANFLENPKIWVFDLLSQDSFDIFSVYNKKQESLSYVFKSEISYLIEEYSDLNSVLLTKKEIPILIKLVLRKKISIETLLILNFILKFFPMWEKRINEEFIWENFRMKCIKYYGFLKFDESKMKDILIQQLKEAK